MMPKTPACYLSVFWIVFGCLIAFNSLPGAIAMLILPHTNLNLDFNNFPAPLDFVLSNALPILLIQFLIGVGFAMGGRLFLRGRKAGRWLLATLSIIVFLWFLFMGGDIHLAAQNSQEVLFPAFLPIMFGLIIAGANIWAVLSCDVSADNNKS